MARATIRQSRFRPVVSIYRAAASGRPNLLSGLRRCASLFLLGLIFVPFSGWAATSGAAAAAAGWPVFRGPHGDGTVDGAGIFSDRAELGLELGWKRALGSGYSGVAVLDGRVVTFFSDGDSDLAVALDEASGEELWRFEIGATYPGHDGSHTGPIASPLIVGGRVFGLGPWGRLFALDLDDGRLVWSVDLVADFGAHKPHYGFGASPMITGEALIIPLGDEKGPSLVAFDPADGRRLWTAGEDTVNFQSPMMFEVGGREWILAAGEKFLYGIDPDTGETEWEYAHGGSGYRGAASLSPVAAGDGRLFLAFRDQESTMVQMQWDGAAMTVETLWVERSIRNSYNIAVYHDGYLYAFSSRFLTCVDAATGESAWKARQPGDGFLILVDGHLVIVTKAGGVHIARATPEGYEERTHLEVFDKLAWTGPSFADGHIYVRSLGSVARIDVGEASGGGDEAARAADGSAFETFLAEAEAAADPATVIDAFLAAQSSFPIIEGDDLVHFVYRGEGEDLALAGDMIGARQERAMERLGDTDLFYSTVRLAAGSRVNYVFVRDYDEIVDPRNPRRTVTQVVGGDMEIRFGPAEDFPMSWVALPGWRQPEHLEAAAGREAGRLVEHSIDSTSFEDGVAFKVYLPAGYDESSDPLPVAYVHGGVGAAKRGDLVQSLDYLIGRRVEPLVVVLIGRNGHPFNIAPYAEMVAEELIPFIDATYRTQAKPAGRAHIGAGFDGFAAVYTAFSHPSASRLGLQSVFMLTTMQNQLDGVLKEAGQLPLSELYLDWGLYDLRNPQENWSQVEMGRELAAELRHRGYDPDGGEVADGTGWSSWKNRTDVLFATLFPIADVADSGAPSGEPLPAR